ncbi:MAG: HAD family hydrolase [Ruminococcaceae bacterium]|nr:HAD family hydrolase [Oscillospiraceae bacterium]
MKSFCWDFDGTITISNPLWTGCMVDALKIAEPNTPDSFFHIIRPYMAFGFPWHTPENDYSSCIGDAWWELMEKHFCDSYIKCGINSAIAQQASKNVRKIITQKSRYSLYDDAIDTLIALKNNGARNILVSNNYPELRIVLNAFGIDQLFDEIIISAEVGYNKPNSKIFELTKANHADDEFFMIGDSVNADIIGGKQNGMKTIFVHNGYFDNADYCFDNLSSVIKLASL